MQSVYSQAVAQGIDKQADLSGVAADIRAKNAQISAQKGLLGSIQRDIDEMTAELSGINGSVAFDRFFTKNELVLLDRYIKEDSIEETSFVEAAVQTFNSPDRTDGLSNTIISVAGAKLTKINHAYAAGKALFSMTSGRLGGGGLSADMIRASFERASDGRFVFAAYLSAGTYAGERYESGCVSMTGMCGAYSDDTLPDPDAPDAYEAGASLSFRVTSGTLFIAKNTTAYQQMSIQWELFEYGKEYGRRSYTYADCNFA